MPLILAIEPDRRQSAQLAGMVRDRLHADLVLGESAERALAALGDRVPDLILTSALLSPKDETELADRLRTLHGDAAHVQTLTIPVLGHAAPRSRIARGFLAALRRQRPVTPTLDGCAPEVFADQCAAYLDRAAAERAALAVEEEPRPQAEPQIESVLAPAIDEAAAVSEDEPPTLTDFEVVNEDEERWTEEPFTIELDLSLAVEAISVKTPPRADVVPQPEAEPEIETWTAVPLGIPSRWPPIEGVAAEMRFDSRVLEAPDVSAADMVLTPAPPRTKRLVRSPAVQDEWGFFDPDQCGLPALIARLDELTNRA